MSEPFVSTPYAEKYLIESDNLRRRQLRAALLHGSGRTWRENRRLWPAVLAGLVAVAIIVASIAVHGAFQRQQRIADEERARQRATEEVRPR